MGRKELDESESELGQRMQSKGKEAQDEVVGDQMIMLGFAKPFMESGLHF